MHSRQLHGVGVRDACARRAGEGRPRGVQPVSDAAEGARTRRHRNGAQARVHRIPYPLQHLRQQHTW